MSIAATILLIAEMVFSLAGCECSHKWSDADCLNPSVCTECGETYGEPLGHNYRYNGRDRE